MGKHGQLTFEPKSEDEYPLPVNDVVYARKIRINFN